MFFPLCFIFQNIFVFECLKNVRFLYLLWFFNWITGQSTSYAIMKLPVTFILLQKWYHPCIKSLHVQNLRGNFIWFNSIVHYHNQPNCMVTYFHLVHSFLSYITFVCFMGYIFYMSFKLLFLVNFDILVLFSFGLFIICFVILRLGLPTLQNNRSYCFSYCFCHLFTYYSFLSLNLFSNKNIYFMSSIIAEGCGKFLGKIKSVNMDIR